MSRNSRKTVARRATERDRVHGLRGLPRRLAIRIPDSAGPEIHPVPDKVANRRRQLRLEVLDLMPLQQNELQRVTANQAVIAPDRNEARIRVGQCFIKPVCILSHFATAIDEGACEYVVTFHPASVTH